MKLLILICLAASVFVCGIRPPPTRTRRAIINGTNVTSPYKWPWQVYVQAGKKRKDWVSECGGTIIGTQWVLTAAHCVDEGPSTQSTVFAGLTQNINSNKGTSRNAVDIIMHPEYFNNNKTIKNDIALIRLGAPFVIKEDVAPVCLPNAHQSIPDYGTAVATGFGAIGVHDKNVSRPIFDGQLHAAIIPVVPPTQCMIRWHGDVPPNVVCASSEKRGTHQGDSGGPLAMRASDGAWYQIGICSYMSRHEGGIDGKRFPKIWTDVRKYCPWIKNTTKGEVHCQDTEVLLENVDDKEIEEKPAVGTDSNTTIEPESSENINEPETSDEPVDNSDKSMWNGVYLSSALIIFLWAALLC